jgi:hypothetical protein
MKLPTYIRKATKIDNDLKRGFRIRFNYKGKSTPIILSQTMIHLFNVELRRLKAKRGQYIHFASDGPYRREKIS